MSSDLIARLVREALARELRTLAANVEASVMSQLQQLEPAVDVSAAPTSPFTSTDFPPTPFSCASSSTLDWTQTLLPAAQMIMTPPPDPTPSSPFSAFPPTQLPLPPVYYRNSQPTPGSRPQCIDQRIPIEIWHVIMAYLYPSQITRLSCVSRTMHAIVSSLNSWSRWFFKAHGPETRLFTLPGMPASKSYMLYMCAVSSRICERCFAHSGLGSINPVLLPLPVHVPVPKIFRAPPEPFFNKNGDYTTKVDYVGLPMNKNWTIRLCLCCRRKHYEVYEEHVPANILGEYKTQGDLLKKYALRESDMDALTIRGRSRRNSNGRNGGSGSQATFSEQSALQFARIKYGGNVGIWAAKGVITSGTSDEKMRKRIDAYKTR
ncbi:hypothetical protein EMPS_07157 [Entomortierella parvispora]|uniref:F-box domain-containing protein n=1 Tax=Entomortierella parvispora TaxID=205924 RepID=A0A9P3LY32_9FUNG|nr:hypothetical protein EMPS_07157 [Entomortierella parvispora]